MAEDKVKYWQSFHSEMTPQDVADELNKMGFSQNKAKVNRMPRKPRYTFEGYNWISVITKSRISFRKKSTVMRIGGYRFSGPSFYFDKEDKLAEVWFKLQPDINTDPYCVNPVAADGEKGFTYFSDALQLKYELKGEDINYGLESESVRIFSDGETRVWLVMEKKYQSCYGGESEKFPLAEVTLHYSDWQRIQKSIKAQRARDANDANDAVEDAINIL